MTKAQTEWLASYDRDTFALSTHAARHCGYGDALMAGLAVNRGPIEMPDLYITPAGVAFVLQQETKNG